MHQHGLTLIFAFLLTVISATAQPPDTLWTLLYGVGNDSGGSAYSVSQTSDVGFILSSGLGGLTKVSASGEVAWDHAYWYSDQNGSGLALFSAFESAGGGYLSFGNICATCLWGPGMVVLRTNENGDSLTSHAYFYVSIFGAPGHTISSLNRAILTSNGEAITIGDVSIVVSSGQWVSYAVVMKLNASGDTVWVSRFPGDNGAVFNDPVFRDVVAVSTGGYLAVGTEHPDAPSSQMLIARISDNGDSLWVLRIGNGRCMANSVQETPDGGFLVLGFAEELAGEDSVNLVKLSSDGAILWTKRTPAYVYRLRRISTGGYAAIYGTATHSHGLIRFDDNGDSLWTTFFESVMWDPEPFYDLIETNDHGYVLAGASYSYLDMNLFVVRTQPDTTVITASDPVPPTLPRDCALYVYPNPFNNATAFTFTVPQSGIVTLRVFDLLGQEVETLLNGEMTAGEHTVSYSPTRLGSGIYFARLQSSASSVTQKLVILK